MSHSAKGYRAGQRQAKEFLKVQKPVFTTDLLSKDRAIIQMIGGLLSGHCSLKRHMYNIGLAEHAIYRLVSKTKFRETRYLTCSCSITCKIKRNKNV